jgi:hypothetical protein
MDLFRDYTPTPSETASAQDRETAWILNHYAPLIGGRITLIEPARDDYGQVWICLRVEFEDRPALRVEVSCDPEGNGPGHLFIGTEEVKP